MKGELILAAATVIVALVVFVVSDRLRPQSWQRTGEELPGTLALDLIKTFFTAVVAFVVVICWQQYANAQRTTATEADALIDVYQSAHAMPAQAHDRIQSLVRQYTNQVVGQEWPVMDRSGNLSSRTQDTFDELQDTVTALRSEDPYVTDLRAEALAGLGRVANARHDRAIAAHQGIPGFLYLALGLGTIMLLLSPVLSGTRVTKRSVAMMVLLSLVVGSVVVLVHNLDRPFSGGGMVPTDAFEVALSRYDHIT